MNDTSSPSGIVVRQDGTKEIPASQRGDGSKRNPIRVRPGFTPTEDVAKYRPSRNRSVLPHIVSNKETTATSSASSAPLKGRNGRISAQSIVDNAHEKGSQALSPNAAPVKQVKSSWADAGWRGGSDTPSRFARSEVSVSSPAKPSTASLKTKSSIRKSETGSSAHRSDGHESSSSESAKGTVETNVKTRELDVDQVEAQLRSVKLNSTTDTP